MSRTYSGIATVPRGSRSLRTSDGIEVWPVSRFAKDLAGGTLWPG